MASTDSSVLGSPDHVINAATERSFSLRRLLSGKTKANYLQGGKSIKIFIQLKDVATAHFYEPDDTESPTQPQSMTVGELPWRYFRDHMAWNDETLVLHTAGLGRNARHRVYKDFKKQYEQAMWTSKLNKLEASLWATPDVLMESLTSGKIPYSFPVFINELTNTVPTSFTTVEQISPTTEANWRNQLESYTESAIANSNLFKAMSKMRRKVAFDNLPTKGAFSDKATAPAVIWTSLNGITLYEDAMRATQDSFVWVGRQDPAYPKPTMHGIVVEYVSKLDTAAIFPTGSAGAYSTEMDTTGTTNAGPRYFFANLQDMQLVLHAERYMYKHPILTPANQPSNHVMYVDTYFNLVCENRRTQGIVYPAADITV